ncbi:MAG: efflux RND transporter permease subunit [Myxococcota bacterium]|nr:efflux RND transporter permease subunit [Myxococcota bacterium]
MLVQLIKRTPAVLLIVFCIVIFGSLSYITLPREAAPDVKIPVVMVSSYYSGVSPEDIESLLTIPIENELASVKDLKKLNSTSAEGASIVTLEFEPEVNIDEALQLVRDRVDKAKPKLPEDATEPEIREISFSDVPILLVTVAGPVDELKLKDLGEKLQDEYSRIPGVLDTTLSGGREREIRVSVDPSRLNHFGFKMGDVEGAIANENVNIPGGDITAGGSSYLVRVPGEFESTEDILNVAIKRSGDRPVFVRDVAKVSDDFADRKTYARMNGQRAVTVGVKKRAGANIIDIADRVREVTAETSQTWPEKVEYKILADQSKQIRDIVTELENNIMTALILVVGVLLFALGGRNSLFVAISIPLSMLLSFVLIETFDMTLNMVVLFSLILALGMLVDNGIVIVENIYRHAEEGKSLFDASVVGTKEVAMAVTASTATTVAAFLPLVFWTGIMGQFMSFLPKTVIIVLVSSLVVALVVLPVATASLMSVPKPKNEEEDGLSQSENEEDKPKYGAMITSYRRLLDWSIRYRYMSALAVFASFILTFIAYGQLNYGTEFFPETEPDRATIAVRAPDGTDLEQTDRIVQKVEGILTQLENVNVFVAETGVSGTGDPILGAQGAPNEARITIDFLPIPANAKPGEKLRVEDTTRTIDTIRDALVQIPGAKITIEKERTGPPVGSPIAVEVAGEDFRTVGELAQVLRRELATIPGATDLTDNYKVGRPEMRLNIDAGAAKRVGASTRAIASAVRSAIAGNKVSSLRDGENEYDIVVTVDERYTKNLQEILELRIPGREDTSPDTFPVPISAVAKFELAGGSGSINHIDQDLVVTIQGDIAEGSNENAVRADVQTALDTWTGPEGYTVRLGGANDEQQSAVAFLQKAFLIAIFLISLVLVTQFNSFSKPFIILASVILSLIGVLWGLIITQTPFGIMMTGLGVISLAGVVVNNAIVLLEYVEQLREEGYSLKDALMEAGTTRFRPVILTAITTILGLVPMALGISFDVRQFQFLSGGGSSQFWGPMAVAVIFGLAFATLLTLILVPTMYSIIDDFQKWSKKGLRVFDGVFDKRPSKKAVATAVVTTLGFLMLGLWSGKSFANESMSVHQVVDVVVKKNIGLQMAAQQTEQQRARRVQVLSALSPVLDVSSSYVINEQEISFNPSEMFPEIDTAALESSLSFLPEEQRAEVASGFSNMFASSEEIEPTVIQRERFFQAGFTLRQTLFSGSTLPGLRAANRMVDASLMDEARNTQQVKLQAAAAFYDLLLARKALALSDVNIKLVEGQKEDMERRVTAGAMNRRGQLQSELALAAAKRQRISTQQQLRSAEEAFVRLTGLPNSTVLKEEDAYEMPSSQEECLALVSKRPDVMAAQHRIDAMRFTKIGWQRQWIPQVNALFNMTYNQNTGFNDDETPWYLSVNASWSLWDGGNRVGQIRELHSQQVSAALMKTQLEEQIVQEIKDGWQKVDASTARLQSLDRELLLAEENLTLVQREFDAGYSTWLDVDQARLMLMQTKFAQASGYVERQLMSAQFLATCGSL